MQQSIGASSAIARRISRWDWAQLETQLDEHGAATPGRLFTGRDCERLRKLFDEDEVFRSTIDMEPKRYGRGRYRYFAAPLPEPIDEIRTLVYPPLARIANRWGERLGIETEFPKSLDAFSNACHEAGQMRPTPLLLRYGPGDYNRLHQDTYGRISFPFQLVVQLSKPGTEFEGGEFLLTEQCPRMQARGTVLTPAQGDAVVFAGAFRPAATKRGVTRATIRHGVSPVRAGLRTTLGVIFHDAE